MGRHIENPRTCEVCAAAFEWRREGVIWDMKKRDGTLFTIELCTECAIEFIKEIRGQNEELLAE